MAGELFQFNEIPQSREWSTDPPGVTYRYKASGEFDDGAILNFSVFATPAIVYSIVGTLYRGNIQIEPDGYKQYVVSVPYTPRNTLVGSVTFRFDTTGATINIKAAKSHVASYPGGGDPHKGAIGVTGADVEGADIIIPALKLVYTVKWPAGVVSEAYSRALSIVTGTTNVLPFRGFAAGELLYVGSTGEDGTGAESSVDYVFVASPNATGMTIGDIAGIAKAGHDYLWIEFKNDVVAGKPVKQPERVHVERVYEPVNFATALGWS